jgi:hypothetical protein
MHPVNPLNGNAAYSIILPCLERQIILLVRGSVLSLSVLKLFQCHSTCPHLTL